MSDISYYTQEGYDKLKAELTELKTKKRAEIAEQISEAREKGDLSENAEYDAAKEAQGLLELEISKLETLLSNARVIDDTTLDTSKAYILSKVKIKNLKSGQEVTYQLVSAKEANLAQGRLSVESPIGKSILGKEPGEKFEVQAPNGQLQFELLEISR